MTKLFIQHLALVSSIVIASSYSFAEAPTCISGTPNSKNLIDQLTKAKSEKDLTKLIYKQYNLGPKSEGAVDPYCPTGECGVSLLKSPVAPIQSEIFKSAKPPNLVFNESCLQASSTFQSGTPQISCPGGSASSSNMCVTAEQLKYQNAVISSFANCAINEGMSGVDLNAMFQKFSLESGFKPQYSSGQGVGVGQLTSIFVDDVHQAHRGLAYMKKIAENKSGYCDAAKLIAEKDINNKPSFANKCNYISIGDGFERNILYSMIGITTMWEKNLEPKLRKYINKNSEKDGIEDVKQLTLMTAYGRGGPAAAGAVIRRLSGMSPTNFVKNMKKPMKAGKVNLTEYTSNISKRQGKIAAVLPEPIKTEFAKTGADACINH